jgi:hypothetical protein
MRKLTELSPAPLPEEKPSNRSKFSPDRDYWGQLHHARYTKWQLGYSEDIAAEEGVTANTIRHSINWCESRLSHSQVVPARNTRLRLRTFAQLSEKYVGELEKLMTDENPIIRRRALEAFRKTVGLEGSGVHVNVNSVNQTAFVQAGQVRNFEQALDHVHRMHNNARVESH